jgi:hypothetical protein
VNFDPRGKLRPGEKDVVMCLAVDSILPKRSAI